MAPSPYPVRPVDSSNIQSLGIIAGSRELPLLIAREARFDPDIWVVEIETDSPETYLPFAEE